jgi:hypothetical protein
MRFCTSFGDCFGRRITSSQAKHLMTVLEKFMDDSTADEASGTCHKDKHLD